MKILFLGTPEFAVPTLEVLLNAGYEVVATVTAPDKPAGRGLHLQQSAVKKFSLEKKLRVLQPEKLKDEQFISTLKSLCPDLAVVVAFRKLPEAVWTLPPMGTFNLHASLLPDYRGAAPINRAIMNGETVTGVTTFFLTHEIDTGKIILQERVSIASDETAGELHDRLKLIGAQLVLETVRKIENKTAIAVDQPFGSDNKKAPKIFTEDCRINFDKPVAEVYNLIRGLSPYPAAFTILNEKVIRVFRATPINEDHDAAPGSVSTDGRSFLRFACRGGWIQFDELQMEGKKRMMTEDFLRGNRIA